MLSKADHSTLIPIKNMDRAIKFYTGKLDGKLNMRGEDEMKDSWASVNVGNASFWLIAPEKREKMELSYNVFQVKGIKKIVEGLQKKGVKFEPAEEGEGIAKVDGPIAHMEWGAKSAFFKDSEGNLLMIWDQPM